MGWSTEPAPAFRRRNQSSDADADCLQGDCEDHATLLCSLLLGFGLDAYVCVGTNAKGAPHAWVLTRGCDGTVTFWESLTAQRLVVSHVSGLIFALDGQEKVDHLLLRFYFLYLFNTQIPAQSRRP